MTKIDEKKEARIPEEQIEELKKKILEGIKQKEDQGKKDKSIKVESKTPLFIRITRNPDQSKFYLSIGPKGGHPVYNKVIFDSSEKLKEFVEDLKDFIKEREDILIAIDRLNESSGKKHGDTV